MITYKAGTRSFPLVYNLDAMAALQEKLGQPVTIEALSNLLKRWEDMIDVLVILIRQGSLVSDQEPEEDDAVRVWLRRRLTPGAQPRLVATILDTITAGLRTETAEETGRKGKTDAVLAELEKKEEAG